MGRGITFGGKILHFISGLFFVMILVNFQIRLLKAFNYSPIKFQKYNRRYYSLLTSRVAQEKILEDVSSTNPGPPKLNSIDLSDAEDLWAGNMHGFDWELEKARRKVFGMSTAYSPFRMDYWKPLTEDGQEEKNVSVLDSLYIMTTNILQFFFGMQSIDGAPVAEIQPFTGTFSNFVAKAMTGNLEELAGGPLFLMLEKYYKKYGAVFKLAFGPRSFIVISNPVMAKHILRKNPLFYDKGVLADILEEIMGKGLIPADPATWKVRRKAIVPGFHARWLNRMIQLFAECNLELCSVLDAAAQRNQKVEMESLFCSVSLDIIGRAVFNYEFGSVTKESPVVKSVYSCLREAERRSTSFVPYWKIPIVKDVLDTQKEFKANMKVLNDILDELILLAHKTAVKAEVEELELREPTEDPSLLRFLVDMRGENATSKQLRDDLMTMLIAGHETTAAVLTWSLFNLVQKPKILQEVREEIQHVLGDRLPTYEDLPKLKLLRYVLAEALRLYPEPPLLIRRALEDDYLPSGGTGLNIKLSKGTDVFISTWNLHRSPEYWEKPEEFDPHRWERPFNNPAVEGWEGYKPEIMNGLYPSEIPSDFAFLPFGGGSRKCVGDQFAMMESCVTLAILLRRYDFQFVDSPEHVGIKTGATIHTANGMNMYVKNMVLQAPETMPSI